MIIPIEKSQYKSLLNRTSGRSAKGLTMIELLAVIVVFGLSVTAVAFRFGKSTDTERLAKCHEKLANVLKTSCSQAKVRHTPVKLTYDLKRSRIRAEDICQYDTDQTSVVEFSLDKGVYIEQVYLSQDDCILQGSAHLLIQPSGWLSCHAVVVRNLQSPKVLFWNPRTNSLAECKDSDHIPWGKD